MIATEIAQDCPGSHLVSARLIKDHIYGACARLPEPETIQGLSGRLNLPISSPFAEGQELALANAVVTGYTGVRLTRMSSK